MEAIHLQHSYYAGRFSPSLPGSSYTDIVRDILRTPKAMHALFLPPPIDFTLKQPGHVLEVNKVLLQIAEQLPCFRGFRLVAAPSANWTRSCPLIAAFIAGVLLRDITYECSLEMERLPAILMRGVSHRLLADKRVSYSQADSGVPQINVSLVTRLLSHNDERIELLY